MSRYYRSMGDNTPAPASHTDDLLEPSFVSDHPDKPKPRTHRPQTASTAPDLRSPAFDRAAGPLPPGAMPMQSRPPMGPVQSPPPPRHARPPVTVHDKRPTHEASVIDGMPHHLSPLLIGGAVVLGLGTIAFLIGSSHGSRSRG